MNAVITEFLEGGVISESEATDASAPVGPGPARGWGRLWGGRRACRNGSSPRVLLAKPSPCYSASEDLGWIATDAVQVGGVVFGIRTDTAATRQAVRSALAPWLVEGYDVNGYLSVRGPSETAPGSPSATARVLRSCTLLGRHRDLGDAVEHLVAEVAKAEAEEAPATPELWVDAAVVVSRGEVPGAVLLPTHTAVTWPTSHDHPRLAATRVILEPETATVVLPRPHGACGGAVNEEAGRIPLRGWVLPGEPGGALADRVIAAAALIRPQPASMSQVLTLLAGMLEKIPSGGLPPQTGEFHGLVDRMLATNAHRNSGGDPTEDAALH